jgi:flagellar FliJ protein
MSGKKFRFSLQKVLEVHEHEASRTRQSLMEAREELKQKQEQLEQARERLADRQGMVEEETVQHPADLRRAGALREDARQAVGEAQAAVEEAQKRVREARSRFQKARKEQRILEKLREQEKGKFDREQKKAEIEFFDEQAVSRHARNDDSSLMGGI